MCILPDQQPHASPAAQLPAHARRQLALAALAGQPVAQLADDNHVSRTFVYRQLHHAQQALDHAFTPPLPAQERVLFHLPVTRPWLEQLALALLLIGHASLRGVHEILRDLFDVHLSVGTLHHLAHQAIARATTCNAQQDLHRVHTAALDEIFQNGRPVLSVVDVASTYCCLLSLEEHRDADTWGVRLLELTQQGFEPSAAIADGGKGLRAGLKLALPDVPCRADVFHAQRDLGQLTRFLENRAYAAIKTCDKLQRPPRQQRRGVDDGQALQRQEAARREQERALALADDVAMLAGWLQHDVLTLAGPALEQRQELFDFVLAELKAREPLCPHRLGPVCRSLENQREGLLAFVAELDADLSSLAAHARVPEAVVREMVAVQEMPPASAERWRRQGILQGLVGERYRELSEWVAGLRGGVVRASSVVENVNSRLRNYFFLRKEVGGGYLELLRFFLNHRRFLRSTHAERVGRSPAELLGGGEQGHWLELLGYRLFRRGA